MKKADYKTIPELLRNKESFRGSSVNAYSSGWGYMVYSYDTLIFSIDNNENIFFDSCKYSSTTSRLQNIINDVFNIVRTTEIK
jgi:hypothetical protein